MSTLTLNLVNWQPYLIRFAGNPRQRFNLFVLGILLFAGSLVLLYLGLDTTPALQLWLTRIGTLTLVASLSLCSYCYLSMLIGRLLHFWQD